MSCECAVDNNSIRSTLQITHRPRMLALLFLAAAHHQLQTVGVLHEVAQGLLDASCRPLEIYPGRHPIIIASQLK